METEDSDLRLSSVSRDSSLNAGQFVEGLTGQLAQLGSMEPEAAINILEVAVRSEIFDELKFYPNHILD